VKGTVYLLHFTSPYRHARHYRGWTADLDARLAQHRAGQGARLMTVIRDAGIGFVVAKTEPGTRARERQLKQRGAGRDCPVCMARRVHLRLAAERGATARSLELAA
jgi:predicted GIY-YIG superfamily endonuclease